MTRRAASRRIIHLRIRTENVIGYGERLVSWCGISRLADRRAEREITKNGRVVTCETCKRVMRGWRQPQKG